MTDQHAPPEGTMRSWWRRTLRSRSVAAVLAVAVGVLVGCQSEPTEPEKKFVLKPSFYCKVGYECDGDGIATSTGALNVSDWRHLDRDPAGEYINEYLTFDVENTSDSWYESVGAEMVTSGSEALVEDDEDYVESYTAQFGVADAGPPPSVMVAEAPKARVIQAGYRSTGEQGYRPTDEACARTSSSARRGRYRGSHRVSHAHAVMLTSAFASNLARGACERAYNRDVARWRRLSSPKARAIRYAIAMAKYARCRGRQAH